MRFSANLTGVFVLYITLPNVQNEDPFKIVLKSLSKGSHMILDRSRNKEHIDLQLSTNLTGVFVLYITLPNVQNEDPFKIVFKISQAFSVSHGWPVSAVGSAWCAWCAWCQGREFDPHTDHENNLFSLSRKRVLF